MPPTIAEERWADADEMPNLDDIVTEDGKPVDNFYVEKLYRLLTEPLYVSWPGPGDGKPFIAAANVGLFHSPKSPPYVPDMMLSLHLSKKISSRVKEGRSYFSWIIGKMPEVVIEIVSDRRGGEDTEKLDAYARLGIPYYVIHDPEWHLRGDELRAFRLEDSHYVDTDARLFDGVGLGLVLWDGEFQGEERTWLRWCNRDGQVIMTGAEKAAAERVRAETESARADAERLRADQLAERLAKLETRLRNLGGEVNGS